MNCSTVVFEWGLMCFVLGFLLGGGLTMHFCFIYFYNVLARNNVEPYATVVREGARKDAERRQHKK